MAAAIAMVLDGKVRIVTLRTMRESFSPGERVKYFSRRGNLRNATVVASHDGRHWLRRPKQREVFIRPFWEVFEP